MSKELQIFEKDDFGTVRTIIVDDKVMFCGSDVAKALGYNRPNDAISMHCRAHTVKHSIGGRNRKENRKNLLNRLEFPNEQLRILPKKKGWKSISTPTKLKAAYRMC